MTTYTPNDVFTAAKILDLSDLVKGGPPTSAANTPLAALADQAFYLLNRLMRYEDVKVITGNYSFDIVNDLRKLLSFRISANTIFSLPDVTAMVTGTFLTIKMMQTSSVFSGAKALTISPQGSQKITTPKNTTTSVMYMHDGEVLKLVVASSTGASTGDHWEYDAGSIGNFFTAGTEYYSRSSSPIGNSIGLLGTFINRQDYPRLTLFWEDIVTPEGGSVDDAIWLSNLKYQGLFSSGDGVSTIRLPDERGMSIRVMDNGRGVDVGRNPNVPGGYEPDQVGAFTWNQIIQLMQKSGADNSIAVPIIPSPVGSTSPLNNPAPSLGTQTATWNINTGKENTIKTLGKYSFINY